LQSTPKSYFLNLALKADNITLSYTRFAFEFYIIPYHIQDTHTQLSSTRYIDDQYTPGMILKQKNFKIKFHFFLFSKVFLMSGN
jgi:hypothetical protein